MERIVFRIPDARIRSRSRSRTYLNLQKNFTAMTRLLIVLLSLLLTQPLFAQRLPTLGMTAPLSADSLLYAAGFRLIGTSVSSLLAPGLSEAQFAAGLRQVQGARCRVYMCNVLFPAELKIAGPAVQEEQVMQYLGAVLDRAQKAGIRNLVLGSGGARRLPEGTDRDSALAAFIALGRKMATAAADRGVTLILESLNRSETNFINTLGEAAAVVRAVHHPAFRLNADIYHMMKEGEPPAAILEAGDLVVYCELAEPEERTLPGVKGADFRPYFRALRRIRYRGPIMVEGRVTDLAAEAPRAHAYLTAQLAEVYGK